MSKRKRKAQKRKHKRKEHGEQAHVVRLTASLGRPIVADKHEGVVLTQERSPEEKHADRYLAAALELALDKARKEERVLIVYTVGGDREFVDPSDTYFVEGGINAPDGHRRVVFPFELIEGWEMEPPTEPEWVNYSRGRIAG